MKSKILNLKNVSVLSKREQESINAGFFHGGCQAMIVECSDDRDCCTGRCGITTIVNGEPFIFDGICAF